MASSQFLATLTPDAPIVQNARFRFDPTDRHYIDDQIRGAQQALQLCVIGGATCTYIPVDTSGPADLAVGDLVCLSGAADTPRVAKALTSPIANAGTIYGIVMQPAARGQLALVASRGAIASRVTGLAGGSPGAVYLDPATGRCSKTSSAYAVGFVDNGGALTLTGAGAGGSGGSGIPGVTITGSPAAGLALTGTSPTTATWITSAANGPQPINAKTQYFATGGGTLDDRPQLVNADAAAAAAGNKTVFYAAGTYLVNSDLTFSTDVGHWFEEGAKIDAPGHTITISGPIKAHEFQQIFTPATKVRFAQYNRNVPRVSPAWWGARADLSFDDGPALQQWIDAVTGRSWPGGAEMVLPSGMYTTRSQLNMYGNSGSAVKLTGVVTSYAGRGSVIRHTGTPIASSTNPSGLSVVFTTDRPHGMLTFDRVKITGHTGNTALPSIGTSGQVTVLSTTTFTINGLLGNGGSGGGATGTAGGSVLQMKGVNNSTFKDVVFDGTGKCNTALWYRTDQAPTGGGFAGANGLYLYGCALLGAAGDLSTLLAIGEDGNNTGGATYQAAEVNAYQCTLTGSADPTNIETMTDACWRMWQGGNVKDNAIKDCNFFGANILIDSSQASGTFECRNCELGGAYRYSILMGGANAIISTAASENANGTYAGGIFLSSLGTGGAGSGMCSITDSAIISPVWDQTIPITSVSNANGANRVVTCAQLPRFAGVGNIVAIDGNSDSSVNGTWTITAANFALNQFTINLTGTGGAAGTGGKYLNKSSDGLFMYYPDKLYLRGNYMDGSDVNLKKFGPPMISGGLFPYQYPSGGSLISENNVYRFGHIQTPKYSVDIASSTNASPIVMTTAAPHGFYPGDQVCIQSHRGNTAALGIWTVGATPSTTTLTLTGSTGNGVGVATGQIARVSFEGIPIVDSGGACTGRSTYADQPLAVYSFGDSAGDQASATNTPIAPIQGWIHRSKALAPVVSLLTPGVRLVTLGEPSDGRIVLEVDWKVFAANPAGASNANVTLCRLKQNSLVTRVGVKVMTPFNLTTGSANTSLRIGTSDVGWSDNFLNGGVTGQYGGVNVSAAAGTVYGHLDADLGADMVRSAMVQGGTWRARGASGIDVIATLTTTMSNLSAGVARVYLKTDNFLVDYYA